MDCRPQDFSVHGIFQARMLEWVTISYFRWSSRPRNQTGILYVSCIGRWNLYPLNHLGSQNICVQFSCSVMSGSLQPLVLQHARLLCPSPTPGACSSSCPSSQWCHYQWILSIFKLLFWSFENWHYFTWHFFNSNLTDFVRSFYSLCIKTFFEIVSDL